ncbi:uncharacterized protein LOC105381435 [Plutella xylostella]|uniref:uncharacterized protein LOC105381435 n=1 Tax=Plutella xylostella TaxID=51655 RepID=UPI0020326113|nr:uncharacterized protein LOC105381435 [Plutella xylostella]
MNLNLPKMSSACSVLTIVAVIIGVAQSQVVTRYTPARGLPTICPSKAAAATCNQLFDRTTIAYAPACPQPQQTVAVAPADDYKSLLQLARSLNCKKCPKCSKNNCTCGNVKSGEIINKLVDGLIAALVNKKLAAAAKPTPAPTPAGPATSPPATSTPTVDLTPVTDVVSGVTPVVGSVVSGVTPLVSSVVSSVLGGGAGGATNALPTETITDMLPTDMPTEALPTDAGVPNEVINSLLSSLSIRR